MQFTNYCAGHLCLLLRQTNLHTKTLILEMYIILFYNIIITTINRPTVGLKSIKFLALLAFRFLFDIFYVTAECKKYSQTSVIERFSSRPSRFPTKKFEISSSFLSSCHEKAAEALCIGRIQTRLGVALVSHYFP